MTQDQWLVTYLWTCLEYIKENHPDIYEECGAEQHSKDYIEMQKRVEISKIQTES